MNRLKGARTGPCRAHGRPGAPRSWHARTPHGGTRLCTDAVHTAGRGTMGGDAAGRARLNLSVEEITRDLIDDYATEHQIGKGEAVDRLVRTALGIESAQRQAAEGLDVMEEMMRRVLGDFTLQSTNMLRQMLDARLTQPHVEASVARLLLFALIAHLKSPEVAIKNEDEALRVARRGREIGEIPLLLRGKKTQA